MYENYNIDCLLYVFFIVFKKIIMFFYLKYNVQISYIFYGGGVKNVGMFLGFFMF